MVNEQKNQTKYISRKLVHILPHPLGWGALFLVVLLQNDLNAWDADDYYILTGFIGFLGIATYINLYLLIPSYLFKRRYWHYIGLVFTLVVVTAYLLTLWMSDNDHIEWFPRLIVNSINIVFVLLLTSGPRLLSEYLRNMMKLKEIENKQLKAELNLLKAQVHPHFLFNTLNNLYGLITQNQNQRASEVTLKLADLMRYLLESSKSDKMSLNKEIQFLEDYLSLEKIRLSKKADISFEVGSINKETMIAPLLFVPLVENATKHGLQTISENCFAHFSLALQGTNLFFEAKNSVGRSLEIHPQSGTGISNLRKRLQLIYPEKHKLEIERTESFFKVTLHLQL